VIRKAEFTDSGKANFIPAALRLPFMTETIAIIAGERNEQGNRCFRFGLR
jgi:hypothetical protein